MFVALDSELNREVALKQILDHHADDPTSRHRFLIEAEITGGLEHPGIVPVYGLGAYADGRPYYAMRFIRGDSLKDAIARFHDAADLKSDPSLRSLELRRLLRRFLDVCNAMEYAYSRGVLHRDLKPGNIIVGKYGETLVVDWGLAKPLGKSDPTAEERTLIPSSASGSADTLPGQAIGTPAYMSPEQARGDLAALGPRSDVYSLGATLYSLLTGKLPFMGDDLGAVLQAVERGDFSPPRRLDSTIDKALEAVCMKAMALKPDDRYATAKALADDIDRWLADEPVTAYPEPFSRRARRWMSRNRTAVAAVAVALMMALAGLGVVSVVQTRANAKLDLQRLRAEDRERQAIDAVKRFRDAVVDNPELKDNPSLESLRKTLLKEPLAFFKSLRTSLQADRDTKPESLARLADAGFALGFLTNEIGDDQDALTAYGESLAIRQKLANAHPSVTQYQSDLAASHNNLGNLLGATGQIDAARKAYEAALPIWEKLADAHPTVTQYQSDLAASHTNLGGLLSATDQPDAARKAYEAALPIWEKLVREHTESPDYARSLGALLNNMATIDDAAKRFDAARDRLQQAIVWQKKALAVNPRNPTYRQFLTNHLTNLIEAARGLGRDAEAERELAELAASDPRLATLDARLAAVLKGEAPKDNAERLALAQRAYDTARFRTAAKLWAEALEADPKLATDRQAGHPYNAACAAALAAAGKGKDEPPLDDTAKTKLRRQARDWLTAELVLWAKLNESGPPEAKAFIVQTLKHWQEDTDLAGIRDRDALSRLSEEERKAWETLWEECETLLKKARGDGP